MEEFVAIVLANRKYVRHQPRYRYRFRPRLKLIDMNKKVWLQGYIQQRPLPFGTAEDFLMLNIFQILLLIIQVFIFGLEVKIKMKQQSQSKEFRKQWMSRQIKPESQLSHNNRKVKQLQMQLPHTSISYEFLKNEWEDASSQICIDQKLIKQKRQIAKKLVSLINATGTQSKQQHQISFQMLEIINKWPNPLIKDKIAQAGQQSNNQESLQKSFKNLCKISNNYHYYGDVLNQTLHGYGLIIYVSSKQEGQNRINSFQGSLRFYEGQFRNNSKHGAGLQLFNNSIYIGKFTNSQPDGDCGLLFTYNPEFTHIVQMYFGSFLNGEKHGEGKWKGQSGQYFGSWKHNKPQGEGQLLSQYSKYRGNIKAGYKHHIGKQLFSNGDRYQGNYFNGKPQGNGVYYWNNGAVYKGEFKNGFRHGFGQWKFGSQLYRGNYINDKRWGDGKYFWNQTNFYQGQFFDDLRHGYGQMSWNQQTVYKGEWKQGYQYGKGQVWVEGKLSQLGFYQNGVLVRPDKNHELGDKDSQVKGQKFKKQKLERDKVKQNKQFQLQLKNPLFRSDHLQRQSKAKSTRQVKKNIQTKSNMVFSNDQYKKRENCLQNTKASNQFKYGYSYLPKTKRRVNSELQNGELKEKRSNLKFQHVKIPRINKSFDANAISDIKSTKMDSKSKEKGERLIIDKEKMYKMIKKENMQANTRLNRQRNSQYQSQDVNMNLKDKEDKLQPINWKNFNNFEHKNLYRTSYGRYSSFTNQNM